MVVCVPDDERAGESVGSVDRNEPTFPMVRRVTDELSCPTCYCDLLLRVCDPSKHVEYVDDTTIRNVSVSQYDPCEAKRPRSVATLLV